MAKKWDREVDYLVVGTGAAGLTAAITAARSGLKTLVIESTDKWGGTTAISGGGLWLPNNPLQQRDGAADSYKEAMAYLDETIGEVGPWTSKARKQAFLQAVDPFVMMLEHEGVRFSRAKEYPDYYPDLPGGKIGRCLEVKPFDVRPLGEWRKTMRYNFPLPVMTDDFWLLSRAWSSCDGFVRGAKVVFRSVGSLIVGKRSYGMGAALAGSLMNIVLRQNTPVWLNTELAEIVVENGEVVGAVINKNGKLRRIKTNNGVMIAAGGFAGNKAWRKKYHGIDGYTSAPDGQLGQGINAGKKAGGALGMMDHAWWGATTAKLASASDSPHGFILNERSDPWSIVIDQQGNRYLNESESYVDFGRHMFERHKTVPAIPSWLVMDHRHTTHFLNTTLMMPGAKQQLRQQGEYVTANNLDELAEKMNVDEKTFAKTIQRFNGFARTGVDKDFGRGKTAYDRYYSSPSAKPNPNLGSIEKGPFAALKLYPGDLGTSGGLVTNEHAQVVGEKGAVIPGLYAAGNSTATVMGYTYPGPGSTISAAAIFGYIGALHAVTK